jgi:hypothetical protein
VTGPDHYRKAERLLAGRTLPATEDGTKTYWVPATADDVAAAQVHATLALAAATALNDYDGGAPVVDYRAWKAVASVENA